jgi:hypothetical protein
MTSIVETMKGRARVRTVFWGYCLIGTLAAGIVLFAIVCAVMRWHPSWRPIANLAAGILFVTYFLWAHISLWTCAFNVKRRGWGYAARCYAVAMVVYYFVGISGNLGSNSVGIRQAVLPTAESGAGVSGR